MFGVAARVCHQRHAVAHGFGCGVGVCYVRAAAHFRFAADVAAVFQAAHIQRVFFLLREGVAVGCVHISRQRHAVARGNGRYTVEHGHEFIRLAVFNALERLRVQAA